MRSEAPNGLGWVCVTNSILLRLEHIPGQHLAHVKITTWATSTSFPKQHGADQCLTISRRRGDGLSPPNHFGSTAGRSGRDSGRSSGGAGRYSLRIFFL